MGIARRWGWVAVLGTAVAGCAHAQRQAPVSTGDANAMPAQNPEQKVAEDFLLALSRGDMSAAAGHFNAEMTSAMSLDRLRSVWQDVLASQGDWVGVDHFGFVPKDGMVVVEADARFARRRQRFLVTVDAKGAIAGFFRGPVPEDAEQTARAFVQAVARGDGNAIIAAFDATMRTAFPPEKALALWKSIEEQSGAFQSIDAVTGRREHGRMMEYVRCQMARGPITFRVVFDADGNIAGVFVVPNDAAVEWTPPPYADMTAFDEAPVRVGSNPTLPGLLTVPRGAGTSLPAVVLVHGSGPNDRDESIGGSKIFRDLAFGLASRGVAVLRYDKRTLVSLQGVVTQKEEVVDGALAALRTLRATARIDPSRLVVLGHSQGGGLAPRIAQLDGDLAGVVVLAGPTRPLEESVVAQFAYLRSLRPADDALAAVAAQAEAFRTAVQAPDLRPDAVVNVPGGGQPVTGAYFLDVRGYHPERVAASLSCSLLVMQGARDYQVTERDDFEGWRRALAGDARATMKLYPALDHRFVAGTGPSRPEDYAGTAHVDAQVIEDIASWIRSIPPARAAQ
jgi:dienelactone hydrolase